jgi:Cu/Zn superoxide dismutase
MRAFALTLTTSMLGATTPVLAQTTPAPALHAAMALATPAGPGAAVGDVTMTQTPSGVMFALKLHGLTPDGVWVMAFTSTPIHRAPPP